MVKMEEKNLHSKPKRRANKTQHIEKLREKKMCDKFMSLYILHSAQQDLRSRTLFTTNKCINQHFRLFQRH